MEKILYTEITGFNPYSPGFSIYFMTYKDVRVLMIKLQSLFTWIFYLFKKYKEAITHAKKGFNPYSPGFSIYLYLTRQ